MAKEEDLAEVLGKSKAKLVFNFFKKTKEEGKKEQGK